MSSRPLNNDRTNYLIWRYLQEHGHAQTAARFQIDWGNRDPDDLPFSQYIRTHSLVYLLQKGLRYHELELSISQPGANSLQPFFGPEESASAQAPNAGAANDDTATTRKHARDSVNGFPDDSSLSAQAPASKRSRRSNGQGSSAANGAAGRGPKSGDVMDIDESSARREPTSTNSPSGAVQATQASGDTEMDLDSESKSNVFQRIARGQSADATADAPSSLHAMAPNSINSSAGSEETGAAAAGGTVSSPAPPAANAESANGHGHWSSQSGAAHYHTQLDPRNPDHQQEGAVQKQAQAQAQAQVAVQAALIPTLKDGRSVGVQSDKVQTVTDLGPETAVLRVPGKNVTHALWSPRDPALLATGGDALCRLWTLSTTNLLARSGASASSTSATANSSDDKQTAAVSTVANGHPNGAVDGSNGDRSKTASIDAHVLNLDSNNFFDLQNSSSDSEVTAMVWSSDGERIAVARHPKDGGRGEVTIHSTKDGTLLDELPGGMEMVINLYWNSPNPSDPASRSLLLGVSHSGTGVSTLMVWDIQNGAVLEPLKVDQAIMDAAWGDGHTFIVCGDNLIAQATVLEGSIEALKPRSDLGEPREWSRICYDPTTRTTAIASDPTGTLALLDSSGAFHTTQAHTPDITAMKFQPHPNALATDEPRLLATGSADGSISVWNTKQPITQKYEMHLGKESQTLAISYTPDGYLLAAASWDTILFWHPETGQSPKAIWKGSSIGWHPNISSVNGHRITENGDTEMTDAEPESTPSLSWDADGRKVAFAFKELIAVVSFRR